MTAYNRVNFYAIFISLQKKKIVKCVAMFEVYRVCTCVVK